MSTKTDHTIVVDTGRSDAVWAVTFHPDGMHLLSGNGDGVLQWRVADGQEVRKQTGMNLNAVSVSKDHKWIVCGGQRGASVWDAERQERVFDVEGRRVVAAIDISPDSTRFATGTSEVSVWSITTGKRLLGPLEHDDDVRGVKFSPNGKRLATACEHDNIRVFDSHDGDQLITIKTIIPSFYPITPLAWSNNGERIFATSTDNRVKCFDVSTGSQRAESQILNGGAVESVALAGNGKFIATFANRSISFLDTSTLTQIGPVIEDSDEIRSIALSPHSSHLATGQCKGKIAIRHLNNVLPDSYGPFHASVREDQQQDEQPSASGGHDDEPPDLGDSDLLELELPSSTPAPLFDYDEPPSPASCSHPSEHGLSPLGTSRAISQPLDVLPVMSPPEVRPEENPDNVKSSEDAPAPKRWLKTMFKRSNKDPTSHKRDRPSTKPRHPAVRSDPQSSATVNATNERPSTFAEGRRQRRSVSKSVENPQRKPPAKAVAPSDPNEAASRSGQNPTDPKEANSAQQISDASQPPAKAINVTHQPEFGKATISLTLPAWMLCFRSGAEDGLH